MRRKYTVVVPVVSTEEGNSSSMPAKKAFHAASDGSRDTVQQFEEDSAGNRRSRVANASDNAAPSKEDAECSNVHEGSTSQRVSHRPPSSTLDCRQHSASSAERTPKRSPLRRCPSRRIGGIATSSDLDVEYLQHGPPLSPPCSPPSLTMALSRTHNHINPHAIHEVGDVAEHVLALYKIEKKRKSERWRPRWQVTIRQGLSWVFAWSIMAGTSFNSFILALKFGERQTSQMVASWLLAYVTTALVVEPVQIVLVALLPFLFTDKTRCGRCMRRARFAYNEYLAP